MAENNTNSNINKPKIVEIDIIQLVQEIWLKRKIVLKVTTLFFAIGILIAFLSPKEYTSSIVMVPQTGEDNKMGGLSSLASLAGVNLSSLGSDQVLSPTVYPQVIGSITFQKELMQTQVKFKDIDHPVSLLDYYTKDEYKKIKIFKTATKYTIGLPGVILKSLKKEQPKAQDTLYITLSEDEKNVMEMLSNMVNFSLDEKEGTVALSANAPEPLVATQLVIASQELLQQYITKVKIEKAQTSLNFIQERFDEARLEYEKSQRLLASYRDLNRNITSAVSKTQEEKLVNDYNLAYTIYGEMAKQLEQAKIQVKDATPVFSIIQPAYIPLEKTKPQRVLIVFLFSFIGGILSCGYIMTKHVYEKMQ
jgi:LPS O-antigen subunit length determinant protein (WzzB/FepE family)